MIRRAYKLVRVIPTEHMENAGNAIQHRETDTTISDEKGECFAPLSAGYAECHRFEYFSHQQFDEPDLNLVSILNFYHYRSQKSNGQASLRYGENHVKHEKIMDSFETPRNYPG